MSVFSGLLQALVSRTKYLGRLCGAFIALDQDLKGRQVDNDWVCTNVAQRLEDDNSLQFKVIKLSSPRSLDV